MTFIKSEVDERGQPYLKRYLIDETQLALLRRAASRDHTEDCAIGAQVRDTLRAIVDVVAQQEIPPHPEHEKLALVSDKSQACGEFLSWLLSEKGYGLGQYHVHTDACWPEGENHSEKRRTCGSLDDVLYPTPVNMRKLLAEFFDIDENKIEAEKLAMLDEIRKANAR